MKYDYTEATDLVMWAEEQYKSKNRYKSGGIGRYDADGTRQFDCCGLFKCFMWHDYHSKNAKYYGKTQKDLNCEGLLKEAKEKGDIKTIPEIPGVLVYMKGHMGIYIGNGKVIEATGKKYDKKHKKIYKTYFKGDGADCDGKRTSWTKWFKSPYLTYEEEKKEEPKPVTEYWTPGRYKLLYAKCIRKSPNLSNNIVKVGKCTSTTKKVLTSTKSSANAMIKAGTTITITAIVKEKTRIWGKYGNCYVCLCNKDGSPQATKI